MATRWFVSNGYIPPAVLRRTDTQDEAYVNGQWRPTTSIVDWEYGEDDDVDEVTEARAREVAPSAFT